MVFLYNDTRKQCTFGLLTRTAPRTAPYLLLSSLSRWDEGEYHFFIHRKKKDILFTIEGDYKDSIAQYSLSTAYDVSTASDSIETLIVGAGGLGISADPFGFTFNSDGSKVYVADGVDDLIYEITLGSNFDLTGSATHTGTLATNITNGSGTPCGLTFNNDGSKLFLSLIHI